MIVSKWYSFRLYNYNHYCTILFTQKQTKYQIAAENLLKKSRINNVIVSKSIISGNIIIIIIVQAIIKYLSLNSVVII